MAGAGGLERWQLKVGNGRVSGGWSGCGELEANKRTLTYRLFLVSIAVLNGHAFGRVCSGSSDACRACRVTKGEAGPVHAFAGAHGKLGHVG